MKKNLTIFFVCLSLLVLAVRFVPQPLKELAEGQGKAGLKVLAVPKATVFINNQEVGETPYHNEELKEGVYNIRLESQDALWQGMVKLNSGTISVVNRELFPSTASSSGEILSLEKGLGVTLASIPPQAEVIIDGVNYGKTPLAIKEILAGEHTFIISHSQYLQRSIRANLPANMHLNLSVDLALTEGDSGQYNLTSQLYSNKLSQLIVKDTPTGFLRVRNRPSLKASEVGKVMPGEILSLLEESSSWSKVRSAQGLEGYVSTSYVTKQP